MKVASLLVLMMSSFSAFGSEERLCLDAFLSSNPVFEELVRLRRSIDDGSVSDSERRARQSDYRVRMREAVKRLDIERELLVSMIEARVREERRRPLVEIRSTEIADLAPRTTVELAEELVEELGIERVTLSGKRYLEFYDPTWKTRAWRDDETGLIWSDVIRDLDRKVLWVNHRDAEKICAEFGGRLATKEEYDKLRADFTKPGTEEYVPQFFEKDESRDFWFWSSSFHPNSAAHVYHCSGRYCDIRRASYRHIHDHDAVRCVRP